MFKNLLPFLFIPFFICGFSGTLFAQLQSVMVNEIILEGNRKTKRATILREMNICEGATIAINDLPTILETNRLQLLDYLSWYK